MAISWRWEDIPTPTPAAHAFDLGLHFGLDGTDRQPWSDECLPISNAITAESELA